MNKTILLAVDAAQHVQAAADMTRELSRDTGDQVVVLHVHEFAVGRFGRIRVDCADGEGEQLVAGLVKDLRAEGITAEGDIREAGFGHISRRILEIADDYDARIIVLGARGRHDLPHLPLGSVSHRLLHAAHRPVLIVPRPTAQPATARDEPARQEKAVRTAGAVAATE
ncbi:MAG: universal stress protein [Streptosporangiaceae bacterium]|jgi:nucleotide-binding universal stress UspA family protein